MKRQKTGKQVIKTGVVLSIAALMAALPLVANAAAWQQDQSGQWLLVDDSGTALKGWQNVDGDYYYLDEMGHMLTGMQDIDGDTYYFGEDGRMAADWWLKDGYSHFGTAWYYFKPDGRMAHGWTMASDGKVYYFDSPEYPGAVWLVSGSTTPFDVGPDLKGIASVDYNYVYGDVTEVRPLDLTASRSQFWYQLKQGTGASDEIVEAMVNLVPGKWYQQADRCAAVLWQNGYDKASAYQEMINRGFTTDQASWACCMKWPTINEQGLWLDENGSYVTCEELTDRHKNDINENIDEEYRHDTSTDIRYSEGAYSYTMTGVNAYRENSNVPVNPGLTIADFNYFQDVEKPGENPGNAWQGDVPPTLVPDDPYAAVVPVEHNEDGSWTMDEDQWNEVNEGLENGEYHAINEGYGYTYGPAEEYAAQTGRTVEELAVDAGENTSEAPAKESFIITDGKGEAIAAAPGDKLPNVKCGGTNII